jgi:hypothetical protein
MSNKNNDKKTHYPVVGSTPVEADIHTIPKTSEFKVPVTKTTAYGTTSFDHHDVIKTDKDQIVHKGDKQPTELHEPKAEKNYKLRDDEKNYEFKPRTEITKTKDSSMKVWEEAPTTKEHHYENIHEHGNLGNKEHGIHEHEHVKGTVHEHENVHREKDHKDKPAVIDKIKDTKEHVKEKIKERKDRKEHKDKATKIHGEHKAHEIKHEERVVKPEYEVTEHTRIEGKPEYERTEFTRVEGKPEFERTEYTRTEGNLHPEYTKEIPHVSVGKGHVEIHDPNRPAEIHEPGEDYKTNLKGDDNIHIKFNINKT